MLSVIQNESKVQKSCAPISRFAGICHRFTGAFTVAPVDWADVLDRAERISAKHTVASGHRSMDVLHAASAQHLGVKQFLSFDLRQRDLATALGFETVP